MLTAIRKNGATLAIFACASAGLVAVTNFLTKDQILYQQQEQLKATLNQVVPHSLHDNELYSSCTLVQDELLGTEEKLHAYIARTDTHPTGLAIESIAPDGYNGAIKLIVGMDYNGTITGTRILSHQETPGLGDKIDIRISDWVLKFTGKKVTDDNRDKWKVRKDGGEFDQFTGATITPRAVVKAIRNSVIFYNQHREQIFAQPINCGGEHD